MATMDQNPMDIARENKTVPGIAEAIQQADFDATSRWRKFNGKFSDYFSMLARDVESGPVRAAGTEVLWMNFMNLADEETGSREAVNVFLKPIAEALTAKMEQRDVGGLQSCEIARLSTVAGETAGKAAWLVEENRPALQALAGAAAQQWLRMDRQEKQFIASQFKSAGKRAAAPQVPSAKRGPGKPANRHFG